MEKVLKQKILIVSQYFWPEDFRINDLAQAIIKMGYDVDVITGVPNYPSGQYFSTYKPFNPIKENWNGITVYRLPLFARRNNKLSLILNYLSFLFFSIICLPYFLMKNYSHVLTFSVSPAFSTTAGALLATCKRIPAITWILDLWPESLQTAGIIHNKKIISLFRPIFMWLYNLHSLVLVQSNSFKEHLSKYGLKENKIIYFPNWAEDTYQPLPAKCDEDTLTILYAGNIGEAQDLPTLLQAATELKSNAKVKWIILGDGRMKDWLQNEVKVRKLENTIQIHDRKPQTEMPKWFAMADILYVSLKDDPIMSMTLPGRVQSFMASAKPILAVASGETASTILNAQCGYVTTPSKLTSTIELILKERQTLSSKGLNGRTYYEKNYMRKNRFQQFQKILLNLKVERK